MTDDPETPEVPEVPDIDDDDKDGIPLPDADESLPDVVMGDPEE